MRERLRFLVPEALNIPLDELPDNGGLGNPEKWDSLAHLHIMLAIEQEFGIEVTAEAVMKATSLDAIEVYLCARRGE